MSGVDRDRLDASAGRAPPGAAPVRPRTHALGKRPAKRSAARGQGRSGILLKLLLVLVAVWASAATWFAASGRRDATRLAEEQVELRLDHEDKVKALTRRLVGVASHGILERDGLSGRLADIISRQVELENRQSALLLMADKVGGAAQPAPAPTPAASLSRGRADEDGAGSAGRTRAIPAEPAARAAPASAPTLRLGAPGAPEPPPASLGPRSSLDERAQRQPGAKPLDGIEALPLREQFARLESSMTRLESQQVRYLGALSAGAQNGIALIRASLATLGLSIGPDAPPEPKGRSLRLSVRAQAQDPFGARLASIQSDLLALERWRGLTEIVPLRSPVELENTPTSNFGTRKDPFTGGSAMHAGMDFRGALGTPIRAAAAGRVITADVSGGYGNLVEVEHGNGVVSRYAHLSSFSVAHGQSVAPGTVVGLLGSTGRSTGPHLHYETRINGSAVDPMRFLQAGAQLFNHPPPVSVAASGGEDDASFD